MTSDKAEPKTHRAVVYMSKSEIALLRAKASNAKLSLPGYLLRAALKAAKNDF